MIALDYGILFTLQIGIEGMPGSEAGFRQSLSAASQALLGRSRSVFRFLDGRGHVFATGQLVDFQEQMVGARLKNVIANVKEDLRLAIRVDLTDTALLRALDTDFRPADLPQLQGLPANAKRIYYLEATDQSGAGLVDASHLVGLAPPVLKFPKDDFGSLVRLQDGASLAPDDEDDLSVQFDLRRAPPGLYEATLTDTGGSTPRIYADPLLFARAPLAVAEVHIPAGNFLLQEYQIEFKKKP